MAKLYFRYGAMNSGKTTALMQVAYNYKERGMRVLILKPAIDTKGQDSIISRLGISCKVDQLVTPEMDVVELVRANEAAHGKIACVLCDESQFFTPEQADQLFLVTVDLGIPVIWCNRPRRAWRSTPCASAWPRPRSWHPRPQR